MATRRNPFCSKRLMISPTRPRCTPSGLMAMKVRSRLAMVLWEQEVQSRKPGRPKPAREATWAPSTAAAAAEDTWLSRCSQPRPGSPGKGPREPEVGWC